MRLLNTLSVSLTEFFNDDIPEYVILSHTWEKDEVLYNDVVSGKADTKLGYEKLKKCCEKARNDGFEWVWIDTCCINKESSAELSESVNSMMRFYSDSITCYAYLSDISSGEAKALTKSRWFTRGWTLQELIAPSVVEFYSREWDEMGTKASLRNSISIWTGIPAETLLSGDLSGCSIAERMSWAHDRQTTRIEDMAYFLLGIFDINMPMLYGEGDKAFQRLLRELLIQKVDYSIFAWSNHWAENNSSILPSSPADFPRSQLDWLKPVYEKSMQNQKLTRQPSDLFSRTILTDYHNLTAVDPAEIVSVSTTKSKSLEPPAFTSRGLRITALVSQEQSAEQVMFLNLKHSNSDGGYICILHKDCFRQRPDYIFTCNRKTLSKMKFKTVYFNVEKPNRPFRRPMHPLHLRRHFIQFSFQQPCKTYTVIFESAFARAHPTSAPITASAEGFVYNKAWPVYGVVTVKITDQRGILSSDTPEALEKDKSIAIVVGQDHIPWCLVCQDLESLGDPHKLLSSYSDKSVRSKAIDRVIYDVTDYALFTAIFRRISGRHGNWQITHRLTIAIYDKGALPGWVRSSLGDSVPS